MRYARRQGRNLELMKILTNNITFGKELYDGRKNFRIFIIHCKRPFGRLHKNMVARRTIKNYKSKKGCLFPDSPSL